ncbi:MAG TPA: DUF4438 domain-containing protein [bacterium]|nr:DUF4438 domain-containing protein [bacterium]
MRTNRQRLVMLSVVGQVSSPTMTEAGYRIGSTGSPVILPGTGGITYNVKVGHPACGWVADHVEPGVSVKNVSPKEGVRSANAALNTLASIGNEALVMTGDAKGARGVVTGKHGGIEHVLVDFDQKTLERLAIGDTVLVRAFGTGLAIEGFDDVKLMNLDPDLLSKMNVAVAKNKLEIGVAYVVPSALMGSGIGKVHAHSGDYDIQLLDPATVERTGLGGISLGDIVAIKDADHTFGRMYRRGAVTVGVVVHSDCVLSGHGPGVTTIMTSSRGTLVPVIDPAANIGRLLGIGIHRKRTKGART